MKFLSLATSLSILSVVYSKTVYVTRTHISTVYGGDAGTAKSIETVVPSEALISTVNISESSEQASESTAIDTDEVINLTQVVSTNDVDADTTSSSTSLTSSVQPTTLSTKTTSSASSTSSSGSSSYADIDKSAGIDKDFSKTILDAHNQKRALHGVGDLSWDKDVYEYAQAYADKYDCSGSLTHSGGQYGENLAVGFAAGNSALEAWYDEGANYDYSSASSFDHFTQVVWKGTTKLGCAYKDCSAENWGKYIICSYDPAGNVVGEGKLNILSG